jgi:hypothetical protein
MKTEDESGRVMSIASAVFSVRKGALSVIGRENDRFRVNMSGRARASRDQAARVCRSRGSRGTEMWRTFRAKTERSFLSLPGIVNAFAFAFALHSRDSTRGQGVLRFEYRECAKHIAAR